MNETIPTLRTFTDGVLKWNWDGETLRVLASKSAWLKSSFRNPEDLLAKGRNIRETTGEKDGAK